MFENVALPVTVSVFDRETLPVIATVFANVTLPVTVIVFEKLALPVTAIVLEKDALPVTATEFENVALPVTAIVLESVAAPRTARVPSVSTAVDVITVFTDELPTLICVVERFTFAPIFTATEAFAVVVLIPPLNLDKPVVVTMLAKVTFPVTAKVFEKMTLPVTAKLLARIVFPVIATLFAKLAAPVVFAAAWKTTFEETYNVLAIDTLPPLSVVFATRVLAEKIPFNWAFPVVVPVAVLALIASVEMKYSPWLVLVTQASQLSVLTLTFAIDFDTICFR